MLSRFLLGYFCCRVFWTLGVPLGLGRIIRSFELFGALVGFGSEIEIRWLRFRPVPSHDVVLVTLESVSASEKACWVSRTHDLSKPIFPRLTWFAVLSWLWQASSCACLEVSGGLLPRVKTRPRQQQWILHFQLVGQLVLVSRLTAIIKRRYNIYL